jgi:hypothetical protein
MLYNDLLNKHLLSLNSLSQDDLYKFVSSKIWDYNSYFGAISCNDKEITYYTYVIRFDNTCLTLSVYDNSTQKTIISYNLIEDRFNSLFDKLNLMKYSHKSISKIIDDLIKKSIL